MSDGDTEKNEISYFCANLLIISVFPTPEIDDELSQKLYNHSILIK